MSGTIEIYRGTHGEMEQAFYESALREQGIPCIVKSAGVAQHPIQVGPMGEFRILVAPEDAARARAVIAEMKAAEDADNESTEEVGAFRRPQTPSERKASLILGGLLLALSLYLIVPPREISGVGLILLFVAALALVSSNRG